MKSNRGVTTANLIVYVIAMLVVIGIISTITSFFYTNVLNLENNSTNISALTKFNMYFLEETKNKKNDIIEYDSSHITFLTGNTFTLQDNSIYLNKIKICEDIENMEIKLEQLNNKKVINVLITIGNNMEYTKNTRYVMKK